MKKLLKSKIKRKEVQVVIKIFSLYMPQFNEERKIHLYLPDDYEQSEKRYPVLYMFDGHNLFDDQCATYGRSWRLGDQIKAANKDLIVVGQECSHQGNNRLDEYGPYPFSSEYQEESFEGHGYQTMRFFIDTLKPYIDSHYRSKPARKYTWIAGSSCGGLMAYYAGIRFSSTFSKAVCVSPYFHPTMPYLYEDSTKLSIRKKTAFYLSWGSEESGSHGFVNETIDCLSLSNVLIKRGLSIHFNVRKNGRHCEEDWEKEIPEILDFLWTDQ